MRRFGPIQFAAQVTCLLSIVRRAGCVPRGGCVGWAGLAGCFSPASSSSLPVVKDARGGGDAAFIGMMEAAHVRCVGLLNETEAAAPVRRKNIVDPARENGFLFLNLVLLIVDQNV